MSWISTLSFTQWAILAAVPLGIVLLYFLKLRREPVEVPSTYLWSRTIEDLHVNSLLQRLRRSLLLLLQLLAIAAAAIALMRPGIRGETTGEGRFVFLLDTSASMQTTDAGDNQSRFEKAKQLIGQRIETMNDTDTAMLITFSDRAETVQAFTSDRRRLREALSRVEVTNYPTRILGALKAADGLANPRRTSEVGNVDDVQVADGMPADLLIYSDGRFEKVPEFNLGNLKPEYVSVGGKQVRNMAITAFSAQRNIEKPFEVQVFATVVNLGSEPAETTATLTIDDELLDAESTVLDPGDQAGLSFTIESEDAATLQLQLDLNDDLSIDNTAYAGLAPMRSVSVLVVTESNTPLKLGLSTPKASKICSAEFVPLEYLETDAYQNRAQSGADDLIVYDRCVPNEMPASNTFFIGALPPDKSGSRPSENGSPPSEGNDSAAGQVSKQAGWRWTSKPSPVTLVDIDRTHPLMRYLELYSLLIVSGRAIEGPAGSSNLIGADIGSVLVLSPRDGFQDMVLGFEIISTADDGSTITNTNWYAERSWPVFILNTLRYLAGAAEASGAPSFRPGETVRLRMESAITSVDIQRVGGDARTLTTGPGGVTEVVDTNQPGTYQVRAGKNLADLFAINLFDRAESDIAIADSVDIGYQSLEASDSGLEQRKEYWRWALIAMLGLLAAEWWVYNKRVA